MKLRTKISSGVLLLAALAFWSRSGTVTPAAAQSEEVPAKVPAEGASTTPLSRPEAVTPAPQPEAPSADPALIQARFRSLLPSVEILRSEIEADPHTSPPSLGRFAGELQYVVSDALRDVRVAEALAPELRDCATGKLEGAPEVGAIKVHCYRQLRKLVRAHAQARPALGAELRAAEKTLEPRVRQILEALEN